MKTLPLLFVAGLTLSQVLEAARSWAVQEHQLIDFQILDNIDPKMFGKP